MKKIIELLHVEYFLWFVFGIIIAGKPILYSIIHPQQTMNLLEIYYTNILIAVLIIIFPFVFHRIFEKYPFEKLGEKKDKPNMTINGDNNIVNIRNDNDSVENYQSIATGIGILIQLLNNAEKISNKMYNRSGVYLIFGIFTAFGGVLFFSFQYTFIQYEKDLTKILLLLLPKFGILFFIEFIAFFFLKQYRSAMDEFKYYNEIKRDRESQLALYFMAQKDFEEKDFTKIADKLNLFKSVGRLSKGETTELIESSKYNDNELHKVLDNLDKIIKASKS